MMCNKLKNYHFIVGVDFHTAQAPGPVPPVPNAPHAVTPTPLCFGPWGALTGKPVPTVITGEGGITLQQGTDIGPLIPHICIPIPPSLLTPVVILTSASKSYFGSSSTQIGSPAAPTAVAAGMVVNPNLDCGSVVPSPTGIVVAMNTVSANFTFADFMSGLATMAVEAAIQTLLNLAFAKGPLAKLMNGLTSKIFGSLVIAGTDTLAGRIAIQMGEATVDQQLGSELAKAVIPTVLGLALGSPLGASGSNIYQKVNPNVPDASSPVGFGAGKASGAAGSATQNYFDNPGVDQHPSAAPAPSPTGAPSQGAPPPGGPAPGPAPAPAPAPAN